MATLDILVLGAGGQLGRSLLEVAPAAGLKAAGLTRAQLDITDAAAVGAAVAQASPIAVVNAAAFTDVDGAEDHVESAFAINRDGAANVAHACRAAGANLIHISTDYVFSGETGRPWRPEDATSPANVYGQSKLAGEEAVRDLLPQAAVIRTAWVFSPWGRNFVRTMLRRRNTNTRLTVVDDQIGGPTSALDLARGLCSVVPRLTDSVGGVYHFCGHPATSWYGFARTIFAILCAETGGAQTEVEAVPSERWPTKASRPRNSMLDTTSFEATFGYRPADWQDSLGEVLARLALEV